MGQARKRGTFDQRRDDAIAREARRDGRDAAARVGVSRAPASRAAPRRVLAAVLAALRKW